MFATTAAREAANFWKIAAIAAAVISPFLVYFGTARSIVEIWNTSDTFAHGYIILPITLWLIWKRRQALPLEAAAPCWPALLLLAACGFGWLLAELAAVQVVKQYAFVAMIPLIVLTVLGPQLSSAMAFPLLFLLLAVPFGEVLIDPLIGFTADFTVAALQLTGVPVLRNGTHFEIPTGSWSVVEACSGVRYLISSFTLGCLYAYLSYRSRLRQSVFVLLSIVVPIVANGLRAYLIVMLGHISGMKLAVGVDHLIYGWVFFGLVMFLMFWIGSFWREDMQDFLASASSNNAGRSAPTKKIVAAAAGSIACIGIWPAYASYIEHVAHNSTPAALVDFAATWQEASPFTSWKPRFTPASTERTRYFQRDTRQVGLSLLYYSDSRRDSQLISSVNRMVGEKDDAYRQVASNAFKETISGRTLTIREVTLEGAGGPMLVWHWYWIDGSHTANDYLGKLLLAREKLLLRGSDGSAVIVFAPYAENPEEARIALRGFLAENLDSIESTLASSTAQRREAR